MARCKFGGLAQDVKGKLSGLVFQGGPAGSIIRQKVSGTGEASPGQILQRSRFLEGRRVWRSLTHSQRCAWSSWSEAHPLAGAFGDRRVASGSEACTAVNGQRLALGLATTAVPPGDPLGVPAQIGEVATVTPGTVRITWPAATGPQVGERHQVFTCGTAGPGVEYLGRGWAAVGVHVVTSEGGTQDFNASAVCPRFQWAEGDLVAVRVRRFSPGGIAMDTLQVGTVAAAPVPAVRRGVVFDGVQNWGTLAWRAAFALQTYTFEGWLRPPVDLAFQVPFCNFHVPGDTNGGWHSYFNGEGLRFALGGETNPSGPVMPPGVWQHFALVNGPVVSRLFIGGVLVGEGDAGQGQAEAQDWGLEFGGLQESGPRLFSGVGLCQIRFSSGELYAGPFTPAFPLGPGPSPLGYWPLDEGAGVECVDATAQSAPIVLAATGEGGALPEWVEWSP